jgi:hypothetical protein
MSNYFRSKIGETLSFTCSLEKIELICAFTVLVVIFKRDAFGSMHTIEVVLFLTSFDNKV